MQDNHSTFRNQNSKSNLATTFFLVVIISVLYYFRNMETLLHLLKGSLGTGILAMPNAFYHAGYIFGLFATLIIGFTCTYCIHLLIKAEYELCKRRKVASMTYPATAEAALQEGPMCLRKFAPYSM